LKCNARLRMKNGARRRRPMMQAACPAYGASEKFTAVWFWAAILTPSTPLTA
jgi:hypothetical protein